MAARGAVIISGSAKPKWFTLGFGDTEHPCGMRGTRHPDTGNSRKVRKKRI